jgi:hypothetical protein
MTRLTILLVGAALALTPTLADAQSAQDRSATETVGPKPPAPPIAEHPARRAEPAKRGGQAGKAEPTVWDQTKTMTREQWNKAKKTWAMEKVKWRDCNRKARQEKLSAPKSWSFIASCMTS